MATSSTLMMEFGMSPEKATAASAATVNSSSSKRKRSQSGDLHGAYLSTTPKRNRPTNWPLIASDKLSDAQRSVRRKRGKYGLSSISRRHAMHHRHGQEDVDNGNSIDNDNDNGDAIYRGQRGQSSTLTSPHTGSRFQEGSMNDKPSIVPPSLFLRDLSDHSLAASARSANVDHLMDEYNGGHLRQSIEVPHSPRPNQTLAYRPALAPLSPQICSPQVGTPDKSGLYKFGRLVATSFNPLNVWGSFSRTFKDTKEDMTIRNIEENRRKAQQKADAEARYAEMKAAGLFSSSSPFTVVVPPVRSIANHADAPSAEGEDERHVQTPFLQSPVNGEQRTITASLPVELPAELPAGLAATGPGASSASNSAAAAEVPLKPLKTRKSLFGIRRPSFSNLKRPRSDSNLSHLASNPHSTSTFVSTEAKEQGAGTLLEPTISRRDLGKQQKLNKRVSDLETKLAEARHELNCAINNASPLPNLPSPFEKYKPGKHMTPSTRFRSKFIPGKLGSLPSERLLFPEQQTQEPGQQAAHSADVVQDGANLFTPPTRKSSLGGALLHSAGFQSDHSTCDKPLPAPPLMEDDVMEEVSQQDGVEDDVDSIRITGQSPTFIPSNNEDVDSSLKVLDAAGKANGRKKNGAKKRKSDVDDDQEYRPSTATDDDYLETPRKSKKRKSTSKSSLKAGSGRSPPDNGRSTRRSGGRKSLESAVTNAGSEDNPDDTAVIELLQPAATEDIIVFDLTSNGPTDAASSKRTSIDSQAALDTISEESSFSSTKHDSGITVTVTQAKELRSASRSSPPPAIHLDSEMMMHDAITATPGVDDVPEMPRPVSKSSLTKLSIRKGAPKKRKVKEAINVPDDFRWPDDVF
ncbi:hypothetical protein AAFC00_001323 [Neodothiora populina]|uniref:Uncharacterized protein n=1 Tax=Neodothiora populina TaxID=2781224 RepID=A0ABR3PNJ4_9PEZI